MANRNEEDLLNPDRVYYRLFRDYADGRLTETGIKLYRARVEEVSREVGDLEQNPPNPVNSVRARVYSGGLDANIPSVALTVFHPMFAGHLSPTVSQGEHVYVTFEDSNFSQGIWISTIAAFTDLNNSDPDIRERTTSNSSTAFEGDQIRTSGSAPDAYGSPSVSTSGRQDNVNNFEAPTTDNPWAGKRIIHIGDSMVGGATLGNGSRQGRGPLPTALKNILLHNYDASFYRAVGRVGWGVNHWLRGRGPVRGLTIPQPSIEALKTRYRADIVLITLGGNDALSRGSTEDYSQKVRELWESASGGMEFAIWCGPPSISPEGSSMRRHPDFGEKRDVVNEKIREVVGNRDFIDCRALTSRPEYQAGRDAMGIHWGRRHRIGVPWARLFIRNRTSR